MVVAEHALDGAKHARFVVDDEDACRPHDVRRGCGASLRHADADVGAVPGSL